MKATVHPLLYGTRDGIAPAVRLCQNCKKEKAVYCVIFPRKWWQLSESSKLICENCDLRGNY